MTRRRSPGRLVDEGAAPSARWSLPDVQAERWLYDALYRTGLARTMWDRDEPDEALARWAPAALPGQRALDIGCGSGSNSLLLAGLGYRVDAIDFSAPAVARCEARASAAGAAVRCMERDVLRYAADPYDLVVDYGCLHNIEPHRRAEYADRVAALTAPGGLFALMALAPRFARVDWRLLGPHHITPGEIAARFGPGFSLEARADVSHYWEHAPRAYRPLSGPFRGCAYLLRRRA
jgi:SAM-dependent methyltransferase